MKSTHLGEHFILELYDCDTDILNNIPEIERIMLHAAALANATVVTKCFHQFSPYGISGTIVIKESHFNIHTWPEHGFAAIDLFTCGDSLEPEKARDYIADKFKAKDFDYSSFKRGVLNRKAVRM